jgi:hypothetical protein
MVEKSLSLHGGEVKDREKKSMGSYRPLQEYTQMT